MDRFGLFDYKSLFGNELTNDTISICKCPGGF